MTSIEADKNEAEFLEDCRKELRRMGYKPIETYTVKEHPITNDPLPRAQPCHGYMATHKLEYDPRTGEYTPVPIIQEYERS